MRRRLAACLVVSVVALGPAPARAASPQMCIGTTAYVVRDESGKVLGPEEMKRLTIKSLNGIALVRRSDPHDASYGFFEGEATVFDGRARRETVRVLEASNPLVFGVHSSLAMCGEIGDLTLEYAGKEMRLLFDIRHHNTYYEIDSPPFQSGTFLLASLACRDCERPPAIDNNTTGKCIVPAESWLGADEEWVRRLVPKRFWGARIDRSADCRDSIRVIDNATDWAAAWALHREVRGTNPLPFVDFDVEMILAVSLAGHPVPTVAHDSILVDKRGNLTFWPARIPPNYRYDPSYCTVLFVQIYRSGVASIAGSPLPRAPAR